MTLAQSSHVIPIPSARSPGLAPKSAIVPNKLRASSFPKAPPHSKNGSPQGRPTIVGGKVAKAVHLFSTLTEEEEATSLDRPAPQRRKSADHLLAGATPLQKIQASASKRDAVEEVSKVDLSPSQPGHSEAAGSELLMGLSTSASSSGSPIPADQVSHISAKSQISSTFLSSAEGESITESSEGSVVGSDETSRVLPLPAFPQKAGDRRSPTSESSLVPNESPRPMAICPTPVNPSSPPLSIFAAAVGSVATSTSPIDAPAEHVLSSETETKLNQVQGRSLFSARKGSVGSCLADEVQDAENQMIDRLPAGDEQVSVQPASQATPTSKSLLPTRSDASKSSAHVALWSSPEPAANSGPESALSEASPRHTPHASRVLLLSDAQLPLTQSQIRASENGTGASQHPDSLTASLSADRLHTPLPDASMASQRSSSSSSTTQHDARGEQAVHAANPRQKSISPRSDEMHSTEPRSGPQRDQCQADKLEFGEIQDEIEADSLRDTDQVSNSVTQASRDDVVEASWLDELDAYTESDTPGGAAGLEPRLTLNKPDATHLGSRETVLSLRQEASGTAGVSSISPPHRAYDELGSTLFPASTADKEISSELIDQVRLASTEMGVGGLQDPTRERTACWIKDTLETNKVSGEDSVEYLNDNADQLSAVSMISPEFAARVPQEDTMAHSAGTMTFGHSGKGKTSGPASEHTADIALRESLGQSETSAPDETDARSYLHAGQVSATSPKRSESIAPHRQVAQKISRSYSQRTQPDGVIPKRAKNIPGRLKIPQREPEVAISRRRRSLELLGRRRTNADQQAGSRRFGQKPSRHVMGITRPSNFNEVMSAWSRPARPQTDQMTPPSTTEHRVGQMIKDWSENHLLSEDEEEASVAVCKRMTLRRMSDFTVHSTPRREPRPLPGKLLRQSGKTLPPEEPRSDVRRMRLVQPVHAPAVVQQKVSPGKLKVKQAQRTSVLDHDNASVPARNAMPRFMREADVHDTLPRTPSRSRDEASLATQSTNIDDVTEPLEVLRSRESPSVAEECFPLRHSPKRPAQSTHSTKRVEAGKLKPLRLQGSQSTFSTPRKPDVSVTTTSPHTILSGLWTPDTSHPAHSALTEETSVSKSTKPRPQSVSKHRVRETSAQQLHVRESTSHTPDEGSTRPSLLEQHRRRESRCDNVMEDLSEAHHFAPRQMSEPSTHVGNLDRSRTSSGLSPLRLSQGDRQGHLLAGHKSTTVRQEQDSRATVPGFEISFQLQEPRMAPHCQDGTLLEFGLRVLIQPTGQHSTKSPWHFQPSSRLDVDARLRSSPHIDATQYEYSHLPAAEMCKVQKEAQDYLLHTLTSPQHRDRNNLRGSLRLPQPRTSGSSLREPGLRSPFQDRDEEAASSSSGTKLPYKDILLTDPSRQPSVSPSNVQPSILSPSVHPADRRSPLRRRGPSAGLSSPLPYIKRATPRSVSSIFPAFP